MDEVSHLQGRMLHGYFQADEGEPVSRLYDAYGLGRTLMYDSEEGAEGRDMLRTKGFSVHPLGADVMVDKDGNVCYSYYSKSLPDRPDADDVVARAHAEFERGAMGPANPTGLETTQWSDEKPTVA